MTSIILFLLWLIIFLFYLIVDWCFMVCYFDHMTSIRFQFILIICYMNSNIMPQKSNTIKNTCHGTFLHNNACIILAIQNRIYMMLIGIVFLGAFILYLYLFPRSNPCERVWTVCYRTQVTESSLWLHDIRHMTYICMSCAWCHKCHIWHFP